MNETVFTNPDPSVYLDAIYVQENYDMAADQSSITRIPAAICEKNYPLGDDLYSSTNMYMCPDIAPEDYNI